MPDSTSTPEPVKHEPRLPSEEDIERLSKAFGHATGELQEVGFRLRAYTRPYFDADDDPSTALPTFEDIGRLHVLVSYLRLDRWALDEEIKTLEEGLANLVTLKDEVVAVGDEGAFSTTKGCSDA